MKNLIIKSFELLVWLMIIVLVIAAVAYGAMSMQLSFLMGLAIIVGGFLYAIIFGGVMFLIIGIHDNTKRTAEALERKG